VEPTGGLRRVGEASPVEADAAPIAWLADSLPDLAGLGARRFDFILLSGVWHHLAADERRLAFARLAELLDPEGRILMSLRHGPGMTARPAQRGVPALRPEIA
jgi:2-polyprenyl-3-methyl-5-hydroxy-6-metoxy-1,4-benzoquinol methylase